MFKIRLIGLDDIVHAEGEVSDAVADAGIIKRNERYYVYQHSTFIAHPDIVHTFREVKQPYHLTEF